MGKPAKRTKPVKAENKSTPESTPEVAESTPETIPETILSAPEAPPPPRELTNIEKVKMMGDLANAVQDTELIDLINKMPSGELIYQLFVDSVEQKLSEIMNGKEAEVPVQVHNLSAQMYGMNQIMDQFRTLMVGFMQTPLVQSLQMLNQKLGGDEFAFVEPPPPEPAPQPQRAVRQTWPQAQPQDQQQPQAQPQAQPQEPSMRQQPQPKRPRKAENLNDAAPTQQSRPGRAGGLGSF